MDNKPKSPGQLAYERADHCTPWAEAGWLVRALWHSIALKIDAQAVTQAVQQREEGKTE